MPCRARPVSTQESRTAPTPGCLTQGPEARASSRSPQAPALGRPGRPSLHAALWTLARTLAVTGTLRLGVWLTSMLNLAVSADPTRLRSASVLSWVTPPCGSHPPVFLLLGLLSPTATLCSSSHHHECGRCPGSSLSRHCQGRSAQPLCCHRSVPEACGWAPPRGHRLVRAGRL